MNLIPAVAQFDAATGFNFSRLQLTPHDLRDLVRLCELYDLPELRQIFQNETTTKNNNENTNRKPI